MASQLQLDPPQTESKERRRHPRHPIELTASLQFPQGTPLACVIRNFCQGGIFCQLQQNFTPPPRNSPLAIVFNLPEQGREVHSLEVRMIRATPDGVGLAFAEPLPGSLFEALHELAQATRGPAPKPVKTPDKEQLREFCLSTGRQLAQKTVQTLLDNIEEQLLQAADLAQSDTERITYIDSNITCRQNSETLNQQFLQTYEQKVEDFFSLEVPSNSEQTDSGQTLSLVDQNDFEDWLNLSESAASIENNFQEALRKLDCIFATVAQHSMDSARSPLTPTALLECLRRALEGTELQNIKVKKFFYQTYKEALTVPFTETLDAFTKTFAIPLDDSVPLEESDKTLDLSPTSAEQETSEPADLAEKDGEAQKPPPPLPAQETGPPHQTQPGLTSSGILQSFAHHLQQSGSTPTQASGSGPVQPLPTQKIVELLPQLQNMEGPWDAKQLEERILALATEVGKDNLDFDDRDKGFIQASIQLANALANESGRSQAIQEQLGRLRLPLLKIALTDPSLLEEAESPAAELINYLGRLEEFLIQNPKNFNAISKLLEDSSKHLLEKDADIHATLEQTNTRLRRLLVPLVRKQRQLAQRLINSYEGRQKIAVSKLKVYQEIIKRLANKPVPEILVRLSDAGWQHLLVLTLLRYGNESKPWKERLGILDKLIVWLSTDPEKELPQRQILNLLERIDSDLTSVSGDVVSHREIMNELSTCLIGTGTPRVRSQSRQVEMAPDHFSDPSIAKFIDMPRPADSQGLAIGDWLNIRHKGNFQPFKLLWIGQFPPPVCLHRHYPHP